MSSTTDKLKGKFNQLTGKGKDKAGDATDNPELRAEGKGQQATGKTQEFKGDVKEKIKDKTDDL